MSSFQVSIRLLNKADSGTDVTADGSAEGLSSIKPGNGVDDTQLTVECVVGDSSRSFRNLLHLSTSAIAQPVACIRKLTNDDLGLIFIPRTVASGFIVGYTFDGNIV